MLVNCSANHSIEHLIKCIPSSIPLHVGEELFYAYGTSWWLGHAREDVLDALAVRLWQEPSDSRSEYCAVHQLLTQMEEVNVRPALLCVDAHALQFARMHDRMFERAFDRMQVSTSLLPEERSLMGRSGGMERAGCSALPPLTSMLDLKLFERVTKLRAGVARPGASLAGGLRSLSPLDCIRRMPKFDRAEFDHFQASLPALAAK